MVDARRPSVTESSFTPVLERHAAGMNFFRFCELLELIAPGSPGLGTMDSPHFDAVRFRSCEHLGFPQQEIDAAYRPNVSLDASSGADVANVIDNKHQGMGRIDVPMEVRTTFLGLYGVDARMPSYFIDTIAQHKEGAEELAAFLDIFHHRIVTQYYRVWRKYRYPVGYRSDGSDDISRSLLSLAGLDGSAAALEKALDARGVMAMLGLLSQKTRTAEGLSSVLQHALPTADIYVEECFSTWVRADGFRDGWDEGGYDSAQTDALRTVEMSATTGGQNTGNTSTSSRENRKATALGDNCLLGRGCFDRSNTILVVLTPRSQDAVLRLVPGEVDHCQLLLLLRLYLGYTSNAHLQMRVAACLMPAPYLHSPHVRLGYTSQFNSRSRKVPGVHDAADTSDGTRRADACALSKLASTRVNLGRWTAGSRKFDKRGRAQ